VLPERSDSDQAPWRLPLSAQRVLPHQNRQRFDLEHLWRFGKQRLLMRAFQTSEAERDASIIGYLYFLTNKK